MADTINGSDRYKIHLKLGAAIVGDTYVPEIKEHRFYLAGRSWLFPTETRVNEVTEITPDLTLNNTVETRAHNKIHFIIGEQ